MTIGALAKYANISFLQTIASQAKLMLRYPERPPSQAGILALVAYTSAGLDRRFSQMLYGTVPVEQAEDLSAIKAAIIETIPLLGKREAQEVRRNAQLDANQLVAKYQPNTVVSFDPVTSVTFQNTQKYAGGNIDFVIRPCSGVVPLAPLSHFPEQEGILDPGSNYRVVDVREGKEDPKRPSPLDPSTHPARTIVLEEI